jgi:hypothetical protein
MKTLEQLVSECNVNGFVPPEHEPNRSSRKLTRKQRKLLEAAEYFNAKQMDALMALLRGDAVLATVRGESYAVRRSGESWNLQGLGADSAEHTVLDGECSCQDCRFRGNVCKHILAVRRLQR